MIRRSSAQSALPAARTQRERGRQDNQNDRPRYARTVHPGKWQFRFGGDEARQRAYDVLKDPDARLRPELRAARTAKKPKAKPKPKRPAARRQGPRGVTEALRRGRRRARAEARAAEAEASASTGSRRRGRLHARAWRGPPRRGRRGSCLYYSRSQLRVLGHAAARSGLQRGRRGPPRLSCVEARQARDGTPRAGATAMCASATRLWSRTTPRQPRSASRDCWLPGRSAWRRARAGSLSLTPATSSTARPLRRRVRARGGGPVELPGDGPHRARV